MSAVAQQLILTLANVSSDALVDWLATSSTGLTVEANALLTVAITNQQLLAKQENQLLIGIPAMNTNLLTAYSNDLQQRLIANYILLNVLELQDSLLDNLEAPSEQNILDSYLLNVAEIGGAVIAIAATDGAATPLLLYGLGETAGAECLDSQEYSANGNAYALAYSQTNSRQCGKQDSGHRNRIGPDASPGQSSCNCRRPFCLTGFQRTARDFLHGVHFGPLTASTSTSTFQCRPLRRII